MNNVIEIKFGTDLGNNLLNDLRFRMEMKEWKDRWRYAQEHNDYVMMDELQLNYERIGLP